jgi:hypothetical protein
VARRCDLSNADEPGARAARSIIELTNGSGARRGTVARKLEILEAHVADLQWTPARLIANAR